MSSKVLANVLLKEMGTIQNFRNINYQQLLKIKGIKEAKACTFLSAIELGRRINQEVDSLNMIQITNSKIVFDYYKNILGNQKQEYFYCLYLDNQKKVIKDKNIFIGTVNYSVVHPREIFKEAYLLSASYIICIHNHPSGIVKPSKEDYTITELLVKAGTFLNIKVIDHVIIGRENYYSFFENNDI